LKLHILRETKLGYYGKSKSGVCAMKREILIRGEGGVGSKEPFAAHKKSVLKKKKLGGELACVHWQGF